MRLVSCSNKHQIPKEDCEEHNGGNRLLLKKLKLWKSSDCVKSPANVFQYWRMDTHLGNIVE